MATDEDLRIKRRYISAFFDELEERVSFVASLMDQGRSQEAMLLCCCYLDGLGNWLQVEEESGSRQNFVEMVRAVDPKGFLVRIHAKQLRAALSRLKGGKAAAALEALGEVDHRELMSEEEVLAQLPGDTDEDVVEWLSRHMWRGTVAAIVL